MDANTHKRTDRQTDRQTHAHTSGTEALVLVLDRFLTSVFVAVELQTDVSAPGAVGFICSRGPTSSYCLMDVAGRAWRGC